MRLRVILIFSLLFFPAVSSAQWEALPGPNGGVLQSLTTTSQGMFLAAQYAGPILYSTDQGQNWTEAWRDFWTSNVVELATAPSGHVFAASYNGMYRSMDGMAWEKTAFSDIPTSIAFVGDDALLVGARGHVEISTNDGDSWELSYPFASNTRSFKVAVADNGSWFAGAYQVGVARSTDQGQSWQPVDAALPSIIVYSLSMIDGSRLFVGLANATYYSLDGGDSWTAADGLLGTNVYRIQRVSPSLLFAESSNGLYASQDDGATWERHAVQDISNVSSVLVYDGGHVLAAADGRLLRSSDQGSSWIRSDAGIHVPVIQALLVEEQDLWVGSLVSGVYHSADLGQNWNYADSAYSPFAATQISRISDGTLFAITQDAGLRRSFDNGIHWSRTSEPPSGYDVSTVAEYEAELRMVDYSGTVYRSSDHGDTWIQVGVLEPVSGRVSRAQLLVSTFADAGSIFAATDRGLFHSSNGGEDWTLLPVSGINRDLTLLAESRQGNLYTATYRSLFRSDDGGATWTEVYASSGQALASTIAINREGRVFIIDDGMMYNSTNLGLTWNVDPPPAGVTVLAMHASGVLYAGSEYSGVFRFSQNTSTASPVPAAPRSPAITDLYPQPLQAGASLHVSLRTEVESALQLRVYDAAGRLRLTRNRESGTAGSHMLTVDTQTLPSGAYVLELQSVHGRSQRSFIITH